MCPVFYYGISSTYFHSKFQPANIGILSVIFKILMLLLSKISHCLILYLNLITDRD